MSYASRAYSRHVCLSASFPFFGRHWTPSTTKVAINENAGQLNKAAIAKLPQVEARQGGVFKLGG